MCRQVKLFLQVFQNGEMKLEFLQDVITVVSFYMEPGDQELVNFKQLIFNIKFLGMPCILDH